MTISLPGASRATALPAQIPGVVFASAYTSGWAFNATGKDDTAALNAALNAARAITTLGNGVGEVWLDAATYFLSGALNLFNVNLRGRSSGGTRITLKSDWCSALPCNAGFALDMQPSVALGAPTQTAATQAAGTSAYTSAQVVSAWITASNSRNGGETPASAMQQITIATNANAPTFHWTAIASADASTTYNVYVSRTGSTDPTTAIKIASGQTGTSYTDATGTGGSGHPPTVDTTGGPGIVCPDFSRVGANPNYQTFIEGLWISGPGGSTPGVVPAHVSGIRQGNASVIRDVRAGGVFAGIYQNLDHEKVYDSRPSGYYGIYRGGPSGTGGDQVYEDLELSGCTWAAMGLAAEMAWGGARFTKVHMASSPFGIYKESLVIGGGAYFGQILSGCHLSEIAFESTGNGNIFSADTANSPAISGNTFSTVQSVNALDPGVKLVTTTQDWQGVAIGRFNAAIDTNNGWWTANQVTGQDPSVVHASSQASVACGMAVRMLQSGDYDATSLINQLRSTGKQFTSGASNGADFIVRWNGTICRGYFASGTISQGDLVMAATGGQPTVTRSTGAAKPIGVALVAATNGQAVLIAQSGAVPVNSSANTIAAGATVIADGTNNGAVVSSGSPTVANYVGVAQQANSGGLTQVLLQGLG